jgi:predicted enzyme related to lactoylglutathione lyase
MERNLWSKDKLDERRENENMGPTMNQNFFHDGLRPMLVAAAMLFFAANAGAADKPALPPLTTVSGSPRLPGKFVWADLVTDDVPAARTFYSQLFGWTFYDMGGYLIAANEGRPLCGMFQKPRPTDPNAKPRWFGYISVASVDRAQKAVTKAGGKVLAAPQKMPKRGEQAVFADAEGAIFGVVRSSAGDPEDFLPDPGDWIWIQLFTADAKKAAEFYRSVGGYEVIENNSTNRMSDFILASKGYARATVRTIPAKDEKIRPNWLPFVRVKSASEAVGKTKLLGGKVLIEPRPEIFGGKVAVVADPTGGAIGLLEWSAELTKGAR